MCWHLLPEQKRSTKLWKLCLPAQRWSEAKLCRLYQKTLETIYELQPPGKHGLKDINTYYHLGLKKVDENFQTLATHYQNQAVKISYHEFVYFQELAE